jgi:HK97 family phage portal protein
VSLFRRTATLPAPVERSISFTDWSKIVTGSGGVTESSAGSIDGGLRQSVVYRCVTLVSGSISTMPVHAYRGRTQIEPTPAVIARPAPDMRRSVWVSAAITSMLLKGGVYGLVDDASMGRNGWPSTVTLIHPDRVTWTADRGWLLDNEPIGEYPLGPLWQVPLHVIPGSPKGLNPLEYARRTIYASLVAQQFGSDFFSDGGHPSALLSPEKDPGAEGARTLKEKFVAATKGNREPMVLPQSIKYTPIQINPDDSQFIDAMRFSDEQLTRFFGVDPAMVGVATGGTSLVYANMSDRREDFKQFTLLLPMYRLEEAMTDLLPRPQDVRFNPAGLLRGSLKERYDSYRIAAEIEQITGEPLLTVAEMRELENREPLTPAEIGAPE